MTRQEQIELYKAFEVIKKWEDWLKQNSNILNDIFYRFDSPSITGITDTEVSLTWEHIVKANIEHEQDYLPINVLGMETHILKQWVKDKLDAERKQRELEEKAYQEKQTAEREAHQRHIYEELKKKFGAK